MDSDLEMVPDSGPFLQLAPGLGSLELWQGYGVA